MLIFFCTFMIGICGSFLLASFAYLNKMLTFSGALATIFTGTVIALAGSWPTWGIILLFFGSSTWIGQIKKSHHWVAEQTVTDKSETRDALQVFANSLPAISSLLLFGLTQHLIFLIGYTAAIAGATADTFASEIGTLSKKKPRSLKNFKPIEPGISGGVSLLGTTAAFFGSCLIAGAFYLFFSIYPGFKPSPLPYIPIIIFSGFMTSFFDSILGAFFQVKYLEKNTNKPTEKPFSDNQKNKKVAGFYWLDNDLVNLFSGILTVLFSFLLYNQFY